MLTMMLAAILSWQVGTWKDVTVRPIPGGAVYVAGVSMPLPESAQETFVLDGGGYRFVLQARPSEHIKGVIVNEAVNFAIEDEHVRVKIAGKEKRLRIVSRGLLNEGR